jgi:hypothetical protein
LNTEAEIKLTIEAEARIILNFLDIVLINYSIVNTHSLDLISLTWSFFRQFRTLQGIEYLRRDRRLEGNIILIDVTVLQKPFKHFLLVIIIKEALLFDR